MRKIVLLFFIIINLYAQYNINYAKNPYHAFLPKKGTFQLLFDYKKMNDAIDIFNIKKQELGKNIENFASIGDMDGGELEFRYTFLKNLMIDISLGYEKIGIGDENLKNIDVDGFIRYNINQNPYSFINSLSFDMGIKTDRGQDVIYTNLNTLKNMVKKITNANKVSIKEHRVTITKGKTYTVTTKDRVFAKLENLSDNSLYFRLLAEKSLSDTKLISMYLKYAYTSLTTKISTNPELLQNAKNNGEYIQTDLDRDENSFGFGINYMQEFSSINVISEIGYQFNYIFRSADLDERNYNNILTVDISYPLNRKFLINCGGKIMFSQFNGIIPYLYNRYSKTTFDHKYGYAYLGLSYNF